MTENNIIAIMNNTEIRDLFGFDSREININQIFESGGTLLTSTIRNGDLAKVTYLVGKGANVNQREEGGATPLLIAIHLNKPRIVKFLLQNGADANKRDSYDTPLTAAVRKEYTKIVKCLVDKNAIIGVVSPDGLSPIFWSIQEGKIEILKLLISRGIPRDIKNASGDSPLIAAVKTGSSNIIQCLLTKGAEIGESSLVWAISKGHLEVIKILIANGADANLVASDGNTLLATAARHRQFEIVKYLITLGVSVCKVGTNGKTPLLWAVQNQDLDIIEWLVHHGAFYIISSVFDHAIQTRNLEIVRFLYTKNNETSPKSINLVTSLSKALEVESLDVVKYLLECGATFASLGTKETVYLLGFIEKKNRQMFELLVENGAKINKSHSGHTPLTRAVAIEDLQMTEKLILYDADINLPNGQSLTALALAARGQNFHLFEYLVRSGATIDNDPYRQDPDLRLYYQTAKEKILKQQQMFLEGVSNQEAEVVEEEEEEEEEVDDPVCTEEVVKEKSFAERNYYVIEFD